MTRSGRWCSIRTTSRGMPQTTGRGDASFLRLISRSGRGAYDRGVIGRGAGVADLAKTGQIAWTNSEMLAVLHARKGARLYPILHRALGHLEHLADFLRGIDWPQTGRLAGWGGGVFLVHNTLLSVGLVPRGFYSRLYHTRANCAVGRFRPYKTCTKPRKPSNGVATNSNHTNCAAFCPIFCTLATYVVFQHKDL